MISASGPHTALAGDALARAVDAQLRRLDPALPPCAWSQAIVEKRATYACTRARPRPAGPRLAPGVYLAGDYVDADYPATLEAAVRSGIAAAEAMRRILIDRARAKARVKRGGGELERVDYAEIEIEAPTAGEDILALDEALAKLMREDPDVAEIVSLRYFAGLKWGEIAEMTGLSERELNRQWEYARAWLRAEMT